MYITNALYKFNKLLINIFFCFNREIRLSFRDKLLNQYITHIENANKDYYIFCPMHCLGDLIVFASYIKAFKEIHGEKVLFLVKDKNRADLIKQISGIDKIIIIDESAFFKISCSANKNNKLQKGKVYTANPDIISACSKTKFKNLPDLYRKSLELPQNPPQEFPNPSPKDIEAVENIWRKNCAEKTVFLSPYAESLNYKILTKDFWLNLAQQLTDAGYKVIFNAKQGDFGGYKCLFLPLSLIGTFCNKCTGTIAFRSGLCDIIAVNNPKNLIILYPPQMEHPDLGTGQRDIWKRTYEFDNNLTDAQNMYKIFSLKEIINVDNAQEIICNMSESELTQICVNSILSSKE